MTVFHLKLIGILTMLIDHIGLFLFPEAFVLRLIGRLAFPIFAWLIANGAHHAKNTNTYLFRLLIFALISQIPFLLAQRQVDPSFWGLNIFFTLTLGLAAILMIKTTKNKLLHVLISLTFALAGSLLRADYGSAGVLSIICFYLFFNDVKKLVLLQSVIFISFFTVPEVAAYLKNEYVTLLALYQPICLLSLIFTTHYNGLLGPKAQVFFYAFYPLHLLLLYLISRFFL